MKSRTVRAGTAVEELTDIDLGDARLNERARRLVGALERHPAAGFPAAVHTEAEREATYRLLGDPRVSVPRPPARQAAGRAGGRVGVELVQVREAQAPADATPVEWLLLTTLPITDPASTGRIVDAYRARWTIEEYFKALKTGRAYEKRQLESRAALLNALGLLAPLAWRLLALRTATEDQAPAGTVLDPEELHLRRARPVAERRLTAVASARAKR